MLANITSKYRAKFIISAYEGWIKENSKVIDIGCGNGVVSNELKKRLKIQLVGCDTLDYLTKKIPFKLMKEENSLPFKNQEFDTAMFNDVLHHIPYAIQEQLIMDALRVTKQVLIFEVQPTIIGKAADYLINKIHNPAMNIPFTFRSISQWGKTFTKHKFKYETQLVKTPLFYPFSHVAFRLRK